MRRGQNGRTAEPQDGRRAERQGGVLVMLLLLTVSAVPAHAQSLADRVAAVRDGEIRMTYAARDGVCGDGRTVWMQYRTEHWEPACDHGPVRVVLTFRAGNLTDVDAHVGGRWRDLDGAVTDLGVVAAAEAAALLLDLAERHRQGREAIFAATLADSVAVWPDLVRLARDSSLPNKTREGAVFWLGQAAGEAVIDELESLTDNPDREIQKAAVFSLSQLRNDQGVSALIRVARAHRDPEVRKTAMFWLGQSGDARAIGLFEEILLRRQ